jgi:HemY protein
VSGRLDAFQWQMPLSALPSGNGAVEPSAFEQAMLAAHPERAVPLSEHLEPPLVEQDNAPADVPAADIAPSPPAAATSTPAAAPPLFRARADIPAASERPAPAIPPIVPIIRPPDDPGVDDETDGDEFAVSLPPSRGQAGGWRGFLSRMRG